MINYSVLNFDDFITNALNEDIGDGDHTSLSCIPLNKLGSAQLIIKQNGILAGIELSKKIFNSIDNSLKTNYLLNDGENVKDRDIAFTLEGSVHSILKAERLVLNCMQHMSGIASATNEVVEKLKNYKTRVLDTRKTMPGLRILEKWAVKIGGGINHRLGLSDMILIKDNHIDYAGGIKQAIDAALQYRNSHPHLSDICIEIEARNIQEVKQVIGIGGINRIMLDNFSFDDLKQAVLLIDGQYETEASGGITTENVIQYAECNVDYVSMGALTHSVKSMDMSLKAI